MFVDTLYHGYVLIASAKYREPELEKQRLPRCRASAGCPGGIDKISSKIKHIPMGGGRVRSAITPWEAVHEAGRVWAPIGEGTSAARTAFALSQSAYSIVRRTTKEQPSILSGTPVDGPRTDARVRPQGQTPPPRRNFDRRGLSRARPSPGSGWTPGYFLVVQ